MSYCLQLSTTFLILYNMMLSTYFFGDWEQVDTSLIQAECNKVVQWGIHMSCQQRCDTAVLSHIYFHCNNSLSLLLFLMALASVSRTAYSTPRGIQWTLNTRLEDLDFADDISMPSHRLQDSQKQSQQVGGHSKESETPQQSKWDQKRKDQLKAGWNRLN